ncbi:hypothetical protein F5B17DRAFT_403966 [Nemania serpens]|nr:hypothetical protein F5B17DRAFT_403966 [Nemania serpens]
MSNPTGQAPDPNEPPKDKRSSFSFSGSFRSLKRAVSKGKTSEKQAGSGKEAEASAESFNASNPFADPPPAYTITPPQNAGESSKQSPTVMPPERVLSLYSRLRGKQNAEQADRFNFLGEFDTVFLIDDSASMTWDDVGSSSLRRGELSRWEQTRNIIEQIVPTCMKYDQDGIDIYFLNDPYQHGMFNKPGQDHGSWRKAGNREQGKASHVYIGITEPDDVKRLFDSRRPNGGTPTGERLGDIMKTYVDCFEARKRRGKTLPKPLNIIVITDGEAGDKEALRNNLIAQAERLDKLSAPYYQLGVQFFQAGKDAAAAAHLSELDDSLGKYRRGKELRDIVDCVTYEQLEKRGGAAELTADMVLKVVGGAVDKHLDFQRIREGRLAVPSS